MPANDGRILRPYNVVVTSVVSYSRKEKEDGILLYACFPVSGGQKPLKMSIRNCFRGCDLGSS